MTVFIAPLASKKLDIRIQWPRCLSLRPPLRVSQKSLMGMHGRMKTMVDAVLNATTNTPQAMTMRRKEAIGKIRYRKRTLIRQKELFISRVKHRRGLGACFLHRELYERHAQRILDLESVEVSIEGDQTSQWEHIGVMPQRFARG